MDISIMSNKVIRLSDETFITDKDNDRHRFVFTIMIGPEEVLYYPLLDKLTEVERLRDKSFEKEKIRNGGSVG